TPTPPPSSPPSTPVTAKPPTDANGTHAQAPENDSFVSLRDVVREYGVPLIHNKVVCPFHDDHKPSCHVYPNGFFCFTCQASGDTVTWLMEAESLTYPEAVEALESFEPRADPPEDDGKTLRIALKAVG